MIHLNSIFDIMPDWESASAQTSLYEDDILLSDLPKFEHDPLVLNKSTNLELTHSELTTVTMLCACILKLGKPIVKVLDIGGHAGRHFVNTKLFAGDRVFLDWTVLETKTIAGYGQQYIKSLGLKFTSDQSWLGTSYDIVIASGSLQYIENSQQLLLRPPVSNSPFLIINRTELIDLHHDVFYRHTSVYDIGTTSFPAVMFSKDDFISCITTNHDVELSWLNSQESSRTYGSTNSYLCGFLLTLKKYS